MMAYIAGVMAHPAFTARFKADLVRHALAVGVQPDHLAPEDFPNELRYDAAARRLFVGKGYVDNVSQPQVDYDVSGMNVLSQWFSYRKKDRRRPIIGDRRPPSPLSDIQPDHWLAEYTSDLLDLLHVLGRLVALEPAQAEVLEDILGETLLEHEQLIAAGALGAGEPAQETEEN